MLESFELPVNYKGRELEFTSSLQRYGYTHRIHVSVDGEEVLFEPDEEGNYRAITSPDVLPTGSRVDLALLQAIAASIENLLK